MYVVQEEFSHEIEVKQSKFIAFVLPVDDLERRLQELKTLHPKARHFIVAWRKMNEFEQIVEYSTDDGEPKGTSGRPVLNVLRGEQLINSSVIIVRYFGGTKLGTGGLVRAYSDAVKTLLKVAILCPFQLKKTLTFEVPYHLNRRLEHYLSEHHIIVKEKSFIQDGIVYLVDLTKEQEEDILIYEKLERIVRINRN